MRARTAQPAKGPAPRRRGAAVLLGLLCAGRAAAAEAPSRSGRGELESPVRIELRAEVQIAGPMVRLGDVAVLDTLELPTLTRLAALPLGPAPRTGTVVRLERAPLSRWIQARAAVRPERIRWAGAEFTAVRLAESTVPGASILQTAREAITEAAERLGLRAELAAAQPQDVSVPAGAVELRPRSVPRAAVLSRHPSVWVDLWVEGRFVRTVPVSFDLTAYGPALVATDRRRPGDPLDRGAVEVREVPWSGGEPLPIAEVDRPLRLRRPIEPGMTITRAHVEPAPLVRRGSFATLRASHGHVSIESKVEVLEDGRPGQTVRVRAASAEGAVLARVTGVGALEVVP